MHTRTHTAPALESVFDWTIYLFRFMAAFSIVALWTVLVLGIAGLAEWVAIPSAVVFAALAALMNA
jgi:hypothetical protein